MMARNSIAAAIGAVLLGYGTASQSPMLDQSLSSVLRQFKEAIVEYVNPDQYYKEKSSGGQSVPLALSVHSGNDSRQHSNVDVAFQKYMRDWIRAIENGTECFKKECDDPSRKDRSEVAHDRVQPTFQPHEYAPEYDSEEYQYAYQAEAIPSTPYQWAEYHHYSRGRSPRPLLLIEEEIIPPVIVVPPPPTANVPEPGTMILMVMGLAGLVVSRRLYG